MFFYITKALIFRIEQKHLMNVKLRYTGARSTKQARVSLQPISKTLAHGDKEITKVYVITADSLIKQLVKILECPQRLLSPLALSLY